MNSAIGYAALLLVAAAAGCAAAANGPFWEMPSAGHPPKTDVKLELFPKHPRLVFRPEGEKGLGRTFSDVRRLKADDPVFRELFAKALKIEEKRRDPAVLAALWTVTGDDELARKAVARMLTGKLGRSGEPYYSNIWRWALAYDWLYNHPALTPEARRTIEGKMAERLGTELDDLDDEGMALWHGRNQAANGCMIAALAIADLPGQDAQLRRAAAHYIESLRALEYSEGWPEGASYWIYNRAGPYALAADCVMSALGVEELGGVRLREVMRRIGFWQLYQYGPNRIFEPYGDSSGSLKLGETGWWELTTDHYARLSRDPALMAGADYLRNRSPDAYGKRPYYWKVVYTYDPAVRPKKDYDREAPEKWMRANLPQSALFGRDSMGVAFFRGKWGDRGE
ncbi:MAG: hypothetical protein ACYTGB_08590, partial [Planctomycetota bacterium]